MSVEEAYNSLKKFYKQLIKDGWTLTEIDEMDIHFYFELMGENNQKAYIDQVI